MPTARKDSPCLYCGKLLTHKGVFEHERHACKKNPNRRKRSFGKKKCRICGKQYHAAGLRAHMATQHTLEFASEKARRKSTSRTAQRRDMVARAESARKQAKKSATDRESPQLRQNSVRSSEKSPQGATEKRRHQFDGRSASSRAWEDMRQKMSRVAAK